MRRYTLGLIDKLRNVTLQERPIQTVTLVSAVQAALRARLRQYEAAKYLLEREQAASRLEELVRERTRPATGSKRSADRCAREPDNGARSRPDADLEPRSRRICGRALGKVGPLLADWGRADRMEPKCR